MEKAELANKFINRTKDHSMNKKEMMVAAIENGTVLDHLMQMEISMQDVGKWNIRLSTEKRESYIIMVIQIFI